MQSAQELIDAMRIHYNFIRPNQAIGGQTPAEAAGIDLNLGDNRVENLMRQAAVSQKNKVESFESELGVRLNKLQILRREDSVESNLKYGLIRKTGQK